ELGGARAQSAGAQKEIRSAAESTPAPAPARKTTPLGPVPAAPPARAVGARRAAPEPRAPEELSLGASKERVERSLKAEKLDQKRLEKAQDPRFDALQKSREKVHEHADSAPAEVRSAETAQLRGSRASLDGDEATAAQAMTGARTGGETRTRESQKTAMGKEEAERRKVTTHIRKLYAGVESKVRAKLLALDGDVDRRFDAGEKRARADFESSVEREMTLWKVRRYGGRAAIPVVGGLVAAGTWVYDKLRGIDHFPEVQKIFTDGKERYLSGLRATIVEIASRVETVLGECRSEITAGRDSIRSYVKSLPEDLRKVGREAAAEVETRFGDLAAEIEQKKEELADKLAERYKASKQKIDARIQEMRAANRGLVDRFVSGLKAVVKAIREFRAKLASVLAGARDVVAKIVEDPGGFLKKLLAAVKKGFGQFKARIGLHLKKGLLGWLFGTLATAGIQMPKDFSVKGVVGLLLQVMGVTVDRLQQKLTRKIGPRAGAAVSKAVGYLRALFTGGPGGLWKEIKKDVGNLKDMVLGQIREWLITKIVKAAIAKLVSMFNPVGAIVQAVLTIYNLVMFFVERIDQILQLVKAIVESFRPILAGKIQKAADAVEKAMGLAVPVVISFLARLLGLGGVAGKVQKIIQRVQRKVDRAIDKALARIAARFKFGKGKKLSKDRLKREKNKKAAGKVVRKALKKGIRRSKLMALLAKLQKKYELKAATLDKNDDITLRNSASNTIKGKPRQQDLAVEAKQVTEKQGGKPVKVRDKLQKGKGDGGKRLILGSFTAQSDQPDTVRGVVEPILKKKGLGGFPYSGMPSAAPRPKRAEASLRRSARVSARSRDAKKTLMVGHFGEAERLLFRGGQQERYEGGHLIGHQFGGPESYDNLVPQKGQSVNNGLFKAVETHVDSNADKLDKGSSIEMRVEPDYPGKASARTSEVTKALKNLMGARASHEGDPKAVKKLKKFLRIT
ncbi:MAG: DNA/RNA non-specific endonuclease, partial [Holophagales bacterium]|nr:DNA/RNA non-specific endonuclease [Holophagales bacterium]